MQISPIEAAQAEFQTTPLTAEGIAAAKSPGKASSLGRVVRAHWLELGTAAVILIVGMALRVFTFFGVPDRLTVDEDLYMLNVRMVQKIGPDQYPALVQNYVETQQKMEMVMLPPTRCVYILLGWAWDELFHMGPRMSLRCVAATFSVLSLLVAGIFAYRLGGTRMGLTVGALMAVAPMELMLAHRELADGVFAFWALLSLWLLWENLQKPGRLGWLAAFAGSVAVMVLTKENSFFAATALGGILCVAALFPKLNLGKPAWSTLAALAAGGIAGVLVLVSLAGSPGMLIEVYKLLVAKAEVNSFAIESGGGPWYRYIVDLLLVSPAVLLPAIGGIFGLKRENRAGIYLLLFVVFSCAIMVNVRNGMNLRYATMWDMPLRYLAAGVLLQMAGAVRRAPIVAAVALVALVGGIELHQYWLLFVRHDIGDPITQFLMYALEIVKATPQ
jgi:4-amino-4-deoxy-L-arabinose transferase-like glycosyltransferase